MATTTVPKTTTAATPTRVVNYEARVRQARSLLQLLLTGMLVAGILSTIVSFLGARDALDRYRKLVAFSTVSADAAQQARSAALAHHSAAADFMAQAGTPQATEALRRADTEWLRYQDELRRIWQNRRDALYGEYAVFNAADQATLRYRQRIDAMVAFASVNDTEDARTSFLQSHDILTRELVPALNGLENMKLESMEEAYNQASEVILNWMRTLLLVGGVAVILIVASFTLTRAWLHYGWTWELALASLAGLVLFGWFNYSLYTAARDVRVMVRDAYDTLSGVQSVEALLTQADAMESMALFDPVQAPTFLRDANQYLFLMEQQLCGELNCSDTPFLADSTVGQGPTRRIRADVLEASEAGRLKYGLPRRPLIQNVTFEGEDEAVEGLRRALAEYRRQNDVLEGQVLSGGTASSEQQIASSAAYQAAIRAANQEAGVNRARFDSIYETITTVMELNRWMTLLFTALGLLGFWGLRRRRQALFP